MLGVWRFSDLSSFSWGLKKKLLAFFLALNFQILRLVELRAVKYYVVQRFNQDYLNNGTPTSTGNFGDDRMSCPRF